MHERGETHQQITKGERRRVRNPRRAAISVVLATVALLGAFVASSVPAAATTKSSDKKAPALVSPATTCPLSIFRVDRAAKKGTYFYAPPDNWARSFSVNGESYTLKPNTSVVAPLHTNGVVRFSENNTTLRLADLEVCALRTGSAFVSSRPGRGQNHPDDHPDCGGGNGEDRGGRRCGPPSCPGGYPPGRCDDDGDDDGIDDDDENENGTDPDDDDSDDDGRRDGVERLIGSNPLKRDNRSSAKPFFMSDSR